MPIASHPNADELVGTARRAVDALDPETFAARADEPDTVVIDLREPDERVAHGSIHRAVSIPRGMLEFRADPSSAHHDDHLDPARPVLLYCASGERSALAGETLLSMGYRSVAHLDGGIDAWRDAGLPLYGASIPAY